MGKGIICSPWKEATVGTASLLVARDMKGSKPQRGAQALVRATRSFQAASIQCESYAEATHSPAT